MNFDEGFLTIRRSVGTQGESTPKSGQSRRVQMTASLASDLFDLLTKRRVEGMSRGWAEPPKWVFCSEAGTALDPSNVTRAGRVDLASIISRGSIRPDECAVGGPLYECAPHGVPYERSQMETGRESGTGPVRLVTGTW